MTTDPLFMKIGSEYYFYHNDHIGTPQKMTSVSGAVVWSATYSSFGEAAVDASSTIVNPLRFPGQYEDAETGLHYNYHRYYDSTIGRYLMSDPIGFWGGINLFVYSRNNPNVIYDPRGLFGISDIINTILKIKNTVIYSQNAAELIELRNELVMRISYLTNTIKSYKGCLSERDRREIKIYVNELEQQTKILITMQNFLTKEGIDYVYVPW